MLNELDQNYGDRNEVQLKDGWVSGKLSKDSILCVKILTYFIGLEIPDGTSKKETKKKK